WKSRAKIKEESERRKSLVATHREEGHQNKYLTSKVSSERLGVFEKGERKEL
ncbi:unnamed protein product, partial [Brassica oleracea]